MEFEWDTQKAAANLRKHKVSFNEAATVFGDVMSATIPDPDHSTGEHRSITIGLSGIVSSSSLTRNALAGSGLSAPAS